MTPHKSAEMKIRFIHQELNLCNDLKVYQNMFLGEEYAFKAGLVNKKAEIKRAQEVLDTMNTGIQATALVADLETAQKQLVEIARALLFKSELIIMDEPTTALNNQEIENLFSIMSQLKAEGVSFIYISHKMPELFTICDRYTVLRDGEFIQCGYFKDITEQQATELLIGKSFVATNLRDGMKWMASNEILLSVHNLTGHTFRDISFDIHKGEIIVITGLQGSGMDELATALFGASPIQSGYIETREGRLNMKSIKNIMKSGIGMIPRNRKERGIIPDLSIRNNNSLAYFVAKHKKPFISTKEETERFNRNREKMDIKVRSEKDPITSLSGGNQQKVIIGKWLEIKADVYIMDNPTQGIDVGSKYAIYKLIHELAGEGKAILVFSNEYPEIHQLADRCIAMYKGAISAVMTDKEITEVKIMEYSTGAHLEGQNEHTKN
ncbi:sugar ABC transporter ATP-binding protein [Brucepastera parasyntrophica]|uniref:sugar ABC transporter ATP-binding protein n=1 Tax=Brucepastera parasyntrophica TaxID=2880008 RepID=UPI00210DE432|nr:sugar ABC transporter ATP-binding protein [Brucepastera parasyntrophica]